MDQVSAVGITVTGDELSRIFQYVQGIMHGGEPHYIVSWDYECGDDSAYSEPYHLMRIRRVGMPDNITIRIMANAEYQVRISHVNLTKFLNHRIKEIDNSIAVYVSEQNLHRDLLARVQEAVPITIGTLFVYKGQSMLNGRQCQVVAESVLDREHFECQVGTTEEEQGPAIFFKLSATEIRKYLYES